LKRLDEKNDIDILWINHTLTHPYDPALEDEKNFLLISGVDVEKEILENEKLMLEHDIMPSVFFRFPGLISDKKLIDKVVSFGLIPVGVDAWLAKNETPYAGSIILIHGNGNEAAGVKKFIELLKNNKNVLFDDLRDVILKTDNPNTFRYRY
jgi:peptidoglycan/xylan/chitin deacetylase (PgdA/CDA1 family)